MDEGIIGLKVKMLVSSELCDFKDSVYELLQMMKDEIQKVKKELEVLKNENS